MNAKTLKAHRSAALTITATMTRATPASRAYVSVVSIFSNNRSYISYLTYCCSCLLPAPVITRAHDRLDISPHMKITFNLDAQRITSRNKVFQDDVDYVLVKDFDVPE